MSSNASATSAASAVSAASTASTASAGPAAPTRIAPLQSGALTETVSRITVTTSDLLLFAAVAMLPFDGTKLGVALPYWTPISPWLFAAYAIVNARYLCNTMRRFLPFFLLPLLLVTMSFYGWRTIGVHPSALAKSLLSLLLCLSCLASLDIGIRLKKVPLRTLLTTLFAAYVLALGTGILQYVSLERNWNWQPVRAYFWNLIYRYYASTRPQFLFAEPSYIGMHVFGVLLPVFWLTKDRRIGALVPVFAIVAIAMGSGTRIVLDSIVAAFLWMLGAVNFRSRKVTAGFVGALCLMAAGCVSALLFDSRLNSLATKGLLSGDNSMSARIFHMLAPMWAWKHDVTHLLFSWGAGNISDAVRTGYAGARRWYDAHGGMSSQEIDGLANPPADTFTMSAYASFITEFGVLCFVVFAVLVLLHITRHHAWNRRNVCWLVLVAYLYVQFESYAFYALPLLLWAVSLYDTETTKAPRQRHVNRQSAIS
ncbi:hypothetical protein [Bifidobacterium biavatii]|uniref:Uncharacterized protein n=1 Tax=Bifidobacterium biavatii DSM 23969 TaxID=1437608 RepID=A0A086ZSZ2_9BIFI|nr:hypothetical protein [Bifidobacterium biavatii]KFI49642.1 hypothetical protein BBIA_1175 [Bifidobacterium biavatii DSM 23969]